MLATISLVKAPLDGEAEEDVGALSGLFQRAEVGIDGKALLVLVHPLGAPLVDDPLGVAHDQVLRACTPREIASLAQAMADGAGAVDDDADLLDLLAYQLQGVDAARADEMMAVPCWSSWKTGMFMVFLSVSSM